MNNYTNTIEVKTTENKAYDALAYKINLWWTEMFEGASAQIGDVFTIRFGESIHKTMRVEEAIPDTKIIWYVEDSLIALPELKNQTEWIGTTIIWEIQQTEESSQIKVTHLGLNPDVECYDICSNGWVQFLGSLKLFLETGTGTPYKEK
ncbi:SRPBCC domain-containing protein [Chryseobacterium indologenes]|uniref:SRPBCC family protein n=1 Tax=Chryseobacterium TaxID=59732 RepID=UPI0016245751|nr:MULTISPECIES: SRPBCC domain-containing protein [Chryseobacterium]MDM1553282.1 SRPBCC domain-containing protein [Chryseobacterium indologenes]WET49403.1 SRPBCC domain-containing protein [Chryseobacterium indologenes]